MNDKGAPSVWVVAGCLFEVSLPLRTGARWCAPPPGPEVALLFEELRGDRHHFRFRAEASGALAGSVSLAFRCDPSGPVEVVVLIAPEVPAGS